MFHGRQVNNNINCLHEKALSMTYEDSTSLFDTLLEKDISYSVHDTNTHQLAMEMYKVTKGLAPTVSSLLFQCSNNRHTRLKSDFLVPQVNTDFFRQNSIRYLEPLTIWNSIPIALINAESSVEFKSLIKNCKTSNRVTSRLKMIVFKHYGCSKKCSQK